MRYIYRSFAIPLMKTDESSEPKWKSASDLDEEKNELGDKGWEIYQEEKFYPEPGDLIGAAVLMINAKKAID